MKKALITGASSGIGFEYAKYLNQNGWSLDLVSHSEERSKKARESFQDRNNNYYHRVRGKNDVVVKYITYMIIDLKNYYLSAIMKTRTTNQNNKNYQLYL